MYRLLYKAEIIISNYIYTTINNWKSLRFIAKGFTLIIIIEKKKATMKLVFIFDNMIQSLNECIFIDQNFKSY